MVREPGFCPSNVPQGTRGRQKEMNLKSDITCQHLPLSISLIKAEEEHPLKHQALNAPLST